MGRIGMTFVELLLVLVVLVIVVALLGARPWSQVAEDAAAVARALRHERASAITAGAVSPCRSAKAAIARVVAWPPRGLLFTPDGLPRTCDGGGVGNTTILLEHRGRRAAVIVSSLGRVRWELR